MLKKISWTFTSNLVTAFVKWLMLIMIAKWLTPTDVGVYALALAITSPLALFANMKLRSLYVNAEEANYRAYSIARNIIALISFLGISLLAFFAYHDTWLIIAIVGLSKMLELVSDLMYALAHREQDMARLSKQIVIKQILLTILFIGSLVWSRDLLTAVTVQVVAQFCYLAIETKLFVKRYPFERTISPSLVWSILTLGLPLGITQLVVSFNTFLPRYALEFFSSSEMLGYFSAIAYITVIANILMGAISQNYLHVFKRLHVAEDYRQIQRVLYRDLLSIAASLCVVLMLASIVAGKWMLTIIYAADYAAYAWLLPWMCICIFFNALNWNIDTLFLSIGVIKKQLYFALISSAIGIPLTAWFVYEWGIVGAAAAMSVNSAVLYITKEFYFRKWLRKRGTLHEKVEQVS